MVPKLYVHMILYYLWFNFTGPKYKNTWLAQITIKQISPRNNITCYHTTSDQIMAGRKPILYGTSCAATKSNAWEQKIHGAPKCQINNPGGRQNNMILYYLWACSAGPRYKITWRALITRLKRVPMSKSYAIILLLFARGWARPTTSMVIALMGGICLL